MDNQRDEYALAKEIAEMALSMRKNVIELSSLKHAQIEIDQRIKDIKIVMSLKVKIMASLVKAYKRMLMNQGYREIEISNKIEAYKQQD